MTKSKTCSTEPAPSPEKARINRRVPEKSWWEVQVEVSPDWGEILSCFLFEQGAEGVHVREESSERTVLAGYFFLESSSDRMKKQLCGSWKEQYGGKKRSAWSGLSVAAVPPQDWTTEWRKDYRPIPVGKTILVQPSWLPVSPAEKRTVVLMDPGNAFGSGTHASTQLCLMGIEEFHRCGETVLDIGCGSGVLAIAAALREEKAGLSPDASRRIRAIEPDLDAVATARKNARRNRVGGRIRFWGQSLEDFRSAPSSLIVANLTALDLIHLSSDMRRLSRAGSLLLLAGLEVRDIFSVLDHYRRGGFRKVKVRKRQGWALLVLQRT